MLWACVTYCFRMDGSNMQNYHLGFVVEADSEDEASGKAMRFLRSKCPSSEGYRNHFAAAQSAEPVDVDGPTTNVTFRQF